MEKSGIEKRARVKFTGKVEFYETGVAVLMPLAGIAVCVKKRGSPTAEITKVINVNIKRHRYTLLPGIQTTLRRVTVRGEDAGDIPTKYTMTGLQPYEIPVVGEFRPYLGKFPKKMMKKIFNESNYHQIRNLPTCQFIEIQCLENNFQRSTILETQSIEHIENNSLKKYEIRTKLKWCAIPHKDLYIILFVIILC